MNSFFSSWTWKMAWRDARSNKGRLFIYISAIILGVAAQVAITSFRENIDHTVNSQAKELLGADLEVETNEPYTDQTLAFFDSLGGQQSSVVEFASMAYFPKTGSTRLSNIRALEGGFPFYGELLTQPKNAVEKLRTGNQALVDQTLMTQFNIRIGDSVKIGNVILPIGGAIEKVPGEAAAVSLIGPRIFIPQRLVDSTNLIQPGSRVEYKTYFKFEAGRNMAAVEASLEADHDQRLRYDTVEERKEEIGEAVANLSKFLNLIGFVALLLGGIGVASAIHVYIKRKVDTAAILRCLGSSARQAMNIFLVQALVLGFIGALCGTLLGLGVQFMLPGLFNEFLPVQVDIGISWFAIGLGFLTGTGVSFIFALLPLLTLSKASPLYTLRTFDDSITSLLSTKTKGIIYLLIAITIAGYAVLLTSDWQVGLFFTAGIIIAFGLLLGVARMLMMLIRRFFPTSWPYVWRQGLANLYRPNNQTTALMVSLGLGVLLISTLYFSQNMLMNELQFASREDAPNLIFYDIQPDQNDGVNSIIKRNGARVIQNVPMVTMRIDSLNGVSADSIRNDSTRDVSGWALRREYRSTYRDTLLDSETLLEGEWVGRAPDTGAVPISLAQEIAEDLSAGIGDTLTFDVQGIPVKTYVGSIREVDFQRVQPNFFVLFPSGVLEPAPQIFVTVTRAIDRNQSVQIQQDVVQSYPNISAIDVRLILSTIQSFIDKISFAIEFMALFSIITGLIVLASSVIVSRFQRIRESVLLRTLGASKRQILIITGVEYLFLGLLSALTGLFLSIITAWALSYFYFDISFIPNLWVIVLLTLGLTGLTLLIGLFSSRDIYKKTPLEILRLEGT
ncbi:MAG: ABC transporter permease [Balneolaceae bacterium]|nr:ABC transporter permease [Balneolaceae bacterium]